MRTRDSRRRNQTQRVVIYRLGSLGDTVVALPCFHQIARTWPDARRTVLTNFPVSSKAAPLEAILREGGLVHDTIEYPVGTRSVRRLWSLARQLIAAQSDVLVYLTPARGRLNALRDWLFFKLCGFKQIVGTPLTQDMQVCRKSIDAESGNQLFEERECERLARCLQILGPIDLDDPEMWDLRLTERELRVGTAVLGPLCSDGYFAINMGGKAQDKDWGVENWRALLTRLSNRYPGTGLLVIGAAEDFERAQQLSPAWCGPFVNACAKLNPRESAAAMRNAMVFIGHDSGPLHLAAAAGVCCVGLFGDLNQPRRWHPRGSQHRIIHSMSGVQAITLSEVLDGVDQIMPLRREYA